MKHRRSLKTVGGVSLASALGDFVDATESAPLEVRLLIGRLKMLGRKEEPESG